MGRSAYFTLTDSDLNPFLFATIGEEHSGMTLSVFSGFARLDLDPWAEAERLARMPAGEATEALASSIGHMSDLWLPAEARRTAERLVLLLPRGARKVLPGRPRNKPQRQASAWLLWLLIAILAIVALLGRLP